MFYTGKGDNGTTSTFGSCDQRISKSSAVTEALGTLDEVNSFLGVVKMHTRAREMFVSGTEGTLFELVDAVQQNLFIVQAEVAGADKHIEEGKVVEIETLINAIEADLPPIKSFFVSGGTELTALVDFARTLSRRAERRVVAVTEEADTARGESPERVQKISKYTLAYLNRLSSLLYAIARQVNHKSGITEEQPHY
ncbi:ATP:cob(I)alamin adenosyltransferase [Candidatus Nomurabacteria bacterium CG1_02_43_90]|uniref:Corrinoid adenosyltransferase n=1 Tax=Candidatus Nomurabacteria bacterium CG1_02_43_90 TaxID=1805281 RepID=A0A1J4V6G3_9BACT|nr:MAG: ATP:cob(I)alamin adenosyltransferase [Candidatus Nomurabacteria bacterium CG1_02_43_90]